MTRTSMFLVSAVAVMLLVACQISEGTPVESAQVAVSGTAPGNQTAPAHHQREKRRRGGGQRGGGKTNAAIEGAISGATSAGVGAAVGAGISAAQQG